MDLLRSNKKIEGNPAEGDIVEVFSNAREFLAMGHYQIGSIAVRIFSFRQIIPDIAFWQQKLQNAFEMRKALGLTGNDETNVYRLVNGEGDGMPGLIMDYYNGVVVIQMHSIGMYRLRAQFAAILGELYPRTLVSVYDKSEGTLPFKANLGAKNEFLTGNTSHVEVMENQYRFNIEVTTGQKTGFFIDQRDNRKLLASYAPGKNGTEHVLLYRRIFNICTWQRRIACTFSRQFRTGHGTYRQECHS